MLITRRHPCSIRIKTTETHGARARLRARRNACANAVAVRRAPVRGPAQRIRADLGPAARGDDPGPQRTVDQARRSRLEPPKGRRRRRRRAAVRAAAAAGVVTAGRVDTAGEVVEDLVA